MCVPSCLYVGVWGYSTETVNHQLKRLAVLPYHTPSSFALLLLEPCLTLKLCAVGQRGRLFWVPVQA